MMTRMVEAQMEEKSMVLLNERTIWLVVLIMRNWTSTMERKTWKKREPTKGYQDIDRVEHSLM